MKECSAFCMIRGTCTFFAIREAEGQCDFYSGNEVDGDRSADGIPVIATPRVKFCKANVFPLQSFRFLLHVKVSINGPYV